MDTLNQPQKGAEFIPIPPNLLKTITKMNPKSGLDEYPLERLSQMREDYEAKRDKEQYDRERLQEIKHAIRRKQKANKLQ
jgi:hypothetical protein